MSVITSIKHKLHIGRKMPMDKNSKTGETGAKIDTEDKVSLSSGSGEEKNSMSLKDAATSGGIGLSLGIGIGNSGRIKNLEKEMNAMKSGKKSDPSIAMEDGKEPTITHREMKALKMISRQAFRDGFISEDFGFGGVMAGLLGSYPALYMVTTFSAYFGLLGAVVLTGAAIGGCSSGRTASKQARREWLGTFKCLSEAESMVELNEEYPEIWTKIMKKG